VVRLDQVIGPEEEVHFVKIDAEGSDADVWKGMEGLMSRNPLVKHTD
jgi:hypothetical protein